MLRIIDAKTEVGVDHIGLDLPYLRALHSESRAMMRFR